MRIDETQLQDNPKLRLLVQKALLKDPRLQRVPKSDHMAQTRFEKWMVTQGKDPTNKYHVAQVMDRTYSDGTVFASKKEMERWDYLLKIQQAGEITDLRRQVPFVLQEAFHTVQYGKVEAIAYVADFTYTNISYRHNAENLKVVEDSKGGFITDVYKIKKKLFLAKYPTIFFFEV